MLRILNEEERGRIREAFAEHPLYAACAAVFPRRHAHLEGLEIQQEDVFCAAAQLFDALYNAEEEQTQEDIDDLWDTLLNDIRDADSKATEHDKRQVTHTVFAIVRKALCHHWETWLRETLFDMLGETIDSEMKDADKKEMQQFFKRLRDKTDAMHDWVNQEYEGQLGEEVERCLGRKDGGAAPNQIFHDNLDEEKIVSALRKIPRGDYGEKQFSLVVKQYFGRIGWLVNRKDTDFVSWMNSRGLTRIKSRGLTHVKLNNVSDELENCLKNTFQMTNGRGNVEDRNEFYKLNRKKINVG